MKYPTNTLTLKQAFCLKFDTKIHSKLFEEIIVVGPCFGNHRKRKNKIKNAMFLILKLRIGKKLWTRADAVINHRFP